MVIRYSPPRRPNLQLRFRLAGALLVLLLSLLAELQLWAGNPLQAQAVAKLQILREAAAGLVQFLYPAALG